MQSTKQAVFLLGEEEYSFDIMDINTVEKVIPVDSVEGFTNNLRGSISLRGEIIPVYSLRRKFGLQDIPYDQDTRFIIIRLEDFKVAYEVDRMKEIVQLDENQVYKTPSIIQGKDTLYIKAVTKIEDRLIIILDDEGILTEDEKNQIRATINI